jgi:hypothetical protein
MIEHEIAPAARRASGREIDYRQSSAQNRSGQAIR